MSQIQQIMSTALDAIEAARNLNSAATRRDAYGMAIDAVLTAATSDRAAEQRADLDSWSAWAETMTDLGPTPWLVTNWIPAGRLSVLSGVGGRGKSRLALQLAAAVAAGDDAWLPHDGHDAKPQTAVAAGPAPAIILSWEDRREDVARGLVAIGADIERIGDRLRYYDLSRLGPIWESDYGSAGISSVGRAIFQDAETDGARLLVIDPSAAAFGGDENRREAVRAFCSMLDGWSSAADCATLLIQHPPKSGAMYSGSTDWHAAARAMITLGVETVSEYRADKWDGVVLRLVKSNYSASDRRIMLAREAGLYGGRWIRTSEPFRCHQSHDVGPVSIPDAPLLGQEGLA